jgi:hypothetical protein
MSVLKLIVVYKYNEILTIILITKKEKRKTTKRKKKEKSLPQEKELNYFTRSNRSDYLKFSNLN